MAGEEKTEKATPKKRRDAREKEGQVLQSKEVTLAATVIFTFLSLLVIARYMYKMILDTIRQSFDAVGSEFTVNGEFLIQTAASIMRNCGLILLPLVLVSCGVPIIVTMFQTKGLVTFKPLTPKFSKLNPLSGIKKLFSMQSVVGIVKGLVELVIIIAIVYVKLNALVPQLKKLTDMEVGQGLLFIARNSFDIVITIAILIVFVAAGDYLFQWWQYEKNLKMSKQEVKEEYKQMEGDPQIKSKIKQKQREIAQQRMMDQVPGSDVVIRNPTHYAVALAYEKENISAAPKVVAKGKDALALKIISVAEENEVYVTEDRPLARELYETVEIGYEIPPSLYNAIAIILSDMYEAKEIKLTD